MKFQIGIIGCGLIGKKRLMNLGKYGKLHLCVIKNYIKQKIIKKYKI